MTFFVGYHDTKAYNFNLTVLNKILNCFQKENIMEKLTSAFSTCKKIKFLFQA